MTTIIMTTIIMTTIMTTIIIVTIMINITKGAAATAVATLLTYPLQIVQAKARVSCPIIIFFIVICVIIISVTITIIHCKLSRLKLG